MVEEICGRMGFLPDLVHESNNVHSILRLVDAGLGVTIIPGRLKNQYSSAKLSFYELSEFNIATELVIAYKRISGNPAAEWFIEKYKELLKGEESEVQ